MQQLSDHIVVVVVVVCLRFWFIRNYLLYVTTSPTRRWMWLSRWLIFYLFEYRGEGCRLDDWFKIGIMEMEMGT